VAAKVAENAQQTVCRDRLDEITAAAAADSPALDMKPPKKAKA
jgi:hypothetical protein